MLSRRKFLRLGVASGAAALLAGHIQNTAQVEAAASAGVHPVKAVVGARAQAAAQTPLAGSAIPQFVDPLPGLDLLGGSGAPLTLEMREFQVNVMPTGFVPASGQPYTGTWVWGYLQPGQTGRASYLGPVIVNTRGKPTEIKFINNLGDTAGSKLRAYTDSVDQTLHWADPLHDGENMCMSGGMNMLPSGECALPYSGTIPAAVHLHGGEVPDVLDGGPDAWFTSDGQHVGHGFYSKEYDDLATRKQNYVVYRYPNSQEGGLIWFHDHTLGATRLNVYAGLAGGYLIIDPQSTYTNPFNFGMPVTPLVIQDRMFDTDGQLFFPARLPWAPNPDHPLWVPEFVGDTICVNGKPWPYLEVEAKRHLFLLVNGSNARTYEMFLINQTKKSNGPALWQVATDGGLLDAPVKIDPNAKVLPRLTLMPGERAWVMIDFGGLPAGTNLILKNVAKAPYPGGTSPNGNTTGRVMQFRVKAASGADTSFNPALAGQTLRSPLARLVNAAAGTVAAGVKIDKIRRLTLNEVMGMPMAPYLGGPLEILVNNTKWMAGNTEDPVEGQTELWEIINLTADAHPMHTHLTQFQLLNRQNFSLSQYSGVYAQAFGGVYQPGMGAPQAYNPDPPVLVGGVPVVGGNPDPNPFLQGLARPPAANEAGWKDTVQAPPGMITRFLVRYMPIEKPVGASGVDAVYPFNPAEGDGYVWHCHIVDHEDNEMMRPLKVSPKEGANRSLALGTDY